MVASLGSGSRSSNALAVINIPGVQKPHWRPWHSMKPCWTGSSRWSTSRPSTVRTECPLAIAASTVQDLTGSPSSCTTQVPQLLVSHPQCVPVNRSRSRRKCTSSMRPSTVSVTTSSLTVIDTCMSAPAPLHGPVRSRAQSSAGQFAGEVPLVVRRTSTISDRVAILRCDLPCDGERLLRRLESLEGLGDCRYAGRVGADCGKPNPCIGDDIAVQPDRGSGRRDGPVASATIDLRVGAAAVLPDRESDLDQDFGLTDSGLVGPEIE